MEGGEMDQWERIERRERRRALIARRGKRDQIICWLGAVSAMGVYLLGAPDAAVYLAVAAVVVGLLVPVSVSMVLAQSDGAFDTYIERYNRVMRRLMPWETIK